MLRQLKNTIKSWISINEYNIVHDLYDKGFELLPPNAYGV